jgi:hypothetical protein
LAQLVVVNEQMKALLTDREEKITVETLEQLFRALGPESITDDDIVAIGKPKKVKGGKVAKSEKPPPKGKGKGNGKKGLPDVVESEKIEKVNLPNDERPRPAKGDGKRMQFRCLRALQSSD